MSVPSIRNKELEHERGNVYLMNMISMVNQSMLMPVVMPVPDLALVAVLVITVMMLIKTMCCSLSLHAEDHNAGTDIIPTRNSTALCSNRVLSTSPAPRFGRHNRRYRALMVKQP